jgi:carboxyl-terminal processing protease
VPAPATAPPPVATNLYDQPVGPVIAAGPTGRRMPVTAIAIGLVAVLAGSALFMAGFTFGQRRAETPGTPVTEDEAFRPFWDAYHAIVNRYAGGDVDRQKLVEGMIKGMINALEDPYSSYLTPEEYRQSLQGVSGEFEGIGAEISTRRPSDGTECTPIGEDCELVVVSPIDGSPAKEAGLVAGDVITAVDGVALDGLTPNEARDRIRGAKGTDVKLSLLRAGGAEEDMTITRDIVEMREVAQIDLADGEVGYLRLAGFSERGAEELAAEIRKDVEAGRTKLILDLRGNPGGFVTAARSVASQFIASGPIVWQEDATGRQEATDAQPGGAATDPSIEVVVLIDQGSASASEIVAGALQDTGRATLVGSTTYGKGTVQTWEPLDGGNGAIRLTIARWLTPNKRFIHEVGIEPDVPVEIPADLEEGEDPALDRAVELLTDEAEARFTLLDLAA